MWTDPFTAIPGQMMTAALWNTQVRDNLLILKTSIAHDGTLNATGGALRRPVLANYVEPLVQQNIAAAGAGLTLDLTYAEHYIGMTGNVTSISFVNSPHILGHVTTCTITLYYPDNTPRTFNWAGPGGGAPSIRWSGGQALVPTSLAGLFDIVVLRTFDNNSWWAAVYGQNM